MPYEFISQPEVTFMAAMRDKDKEPIGCGLIINHGDYAELKRMYVTPEWRGRGIGRRILEALEMNARAAGLTMLRLETGVSQPEALRLYEQAGYTRCQRFGKYPDDPLSVFMEKRLREQ
jgi:putative acetyltransferase